MFSAIGWDCPSRVVFSQTLTDHKGTRQSPLIDCIIFFLKRDLNNKNLIVYTDKLDKGITFNIMASLYLELLPTQLDNIYLTSKFFLMMRRGNKTGQVQGPQSTSSENILSGDQECQRRVFFAGSLLSLPFA